MSGKSFLKRTLKSLQKKAVNYRSSKVLFDLFSKAYPDMKLNWDDTRDIWTKKILTFFGELGKQYDFQIYMHPKHGVRDNSNEKTTEYLLDLCWDFYDEYERAFWIELALECELGDSIEEIMEDFWKLADVKAFIKVGIFRPLWRDRQKVLEEIVQAISCHGIRIPTERYLIIFIFNHGTKEEESKRIEVKGYDIDFMGNLTEVGSKRFPSKFS